MARNPKSCSKGLKAPTDRLFVAPSFRKSVLFWAHDGVLSGQPDATFTLKTLEHYVWWPCVKKDVKNYVPACSSCAANNVPCSLTAGFLQPLPLPRRPWTHLTEDFITNLPNSDGMTANWVLVDHFFKMSYFEPLPGLTTANTVSTLFFSHVVRHGSVPSDIASNRGAQFISRFWKAFCKKLGVTL